MEIKTKRKQGRPIGKNFTVLKQLKINEKQNKNWNRNTPKLIRDLLEGKLVSIEHLKFYNDFFKDNIDYLMKNKDIDLFIEQNEKIFDEIEEMVK